MCVNYEPIRLSNIPKLGLHQPTFEFVPEAWPDYLCPIIIHGEDSEFEWRQAKFGLLPNRVKTKQYKASTENARLETVDTKYSYSQAWAKNQFTLIPSECFFEPNYESGSPVRWKIEREDHEPFTLAGIWDIWTDSNDSIRSFSMLTLNADTHPLMMRFHKPGDEKRSPIVIPPEYRKDWLNADHRTARELLHEIDASQFTASPFPVPPRKPKTPTPPKITKNNSVSKSTNLDLF